MKINGIVHILSPPGHPQSNGLAENAVKDFKAGLSKIINENICSLEKLQIAMAKYLLHYRNVEHSTTGKAPSELMFGKNLRMRLDLLKHTEDISSRTEIKKPQGTRNVEFYLDDTVFARDYCNPNKRLWKKAKILRKIGKQVYMVELEDGRIWKRHLNQLTKSFSQFDEREEIKCSVANTVVPVVSKFSKCMLSFGTNVEPNPVIQNPQQIPEEVEEQLIPQIEQVIAQPEPVIRQPELDLPRRSERIRRRLEFS